MLVYILWLIPVFTKIRERWEREDFWVRILLFGGENYCLLTNKNRSVSAAAQRFFNMVLAH